MIPLLAIVFSIWPFHSTKPQECNDGTALCFVMTGPVASAAVTKEVGSIYRNGKKLPMSTILHQEKNPGIGYTVHFDPAKLKPGNGRDWLVLKYR